jgi:16S rRNA (guanine(966)-N(2))-methyltransferase RsmD
MARLAPEIPGARVLDLFAGSGALGFECLSRGAGAVTFVERSAGVASLLRRNLVALSGSAPLDPPAAATVVVADVFRWIEGAEPVDLALADPPYEQGLAARLLGCFLQRPFARTLWIEHGRREILLPDDGDPPGFAVEARRYGDTVLTRIDARS